MKRVLQLAVCCVIFQFCIYQSNAQSLLVITPDSSFGTNGKMILSNSSNSNPQSAADFAVEPNGKFLVAGAYSYNSGQPYIEQFLSNGSPDNSFGTNGFTILHATNTNYFANATSIQLLQSGKILVTLYADSVLGFANSLQILSVVRINANGTIDQSFGTGGYLNFATDNPNLSSPGGISASQLLVLSSDSIILKYFYTRYDYGTSTDIDSMFILKTDSNGNFDNQFGSNGKLVVPGILGSSNITLCNNNTILASGTIANGGNEFVRYLSNGTPDNSFGQSGVLIDSPGVAGSTVVLQPDNSIVAGGNGIFIHILSNGVIDNTYNNSTGSVTLSTNPYNTNTEPNGILSLNNETVFANNIYESIPGTSYSFQYAQLLAFLSNGITDSLAFPLIDSLTAITVKQLNNKLYFLIDSSSTTTNLYQYNISVSPFIPQSFSGTKTADSTSLLQWTMSSIQNVKDFQLMRSTDTSIYTGAQNWNVIGTINPNAGTSYNFTDSFPVNGNNYYRIKIIGNGGAYTYSPNIVLITYKFAVPDCNAPAPYVYQVTDTSVTVDFHIGGSSNTPYYQYAYMPANIYTYTAPPTGLTLFTASDSIVHITGLSTSTSYYVFVRTKCSNKSFTAWTVATFKTSCDTAGIPYTELFTPSSFPCIAYGEWGYYNNTGAFLSYGYNSQASGWMFTKRFYLTAGKTYRVYFKYGITDFATPTQNSSLMAQMATYQDTVSLIGSPLVNITLNTAQINYQTLDSFALFTPVTNGFYCVGFYSISNAGIGTVLIPEVEVLENPASLPCATNISPANKTIETNFCNNFQLLWNSVPNASNYFLNYSLTNYQISASLSTYTDTTFSLNFCGDPGDSIYWYVVPRVLGQNATGCASKATVFYTPIFSAPANDLCTNAQTLTVTKGFCTSPVVGSLMGATFSNASDTIGICKPSLPPGYPANRISDTADVWYKLAIPSTGNAVVQVSRFNEATSGSTILRAFTGICGSHTPIACANDNGQYYFNTVEPYRVRLYLTNQTPGATIYIRVSSYSIGGNYFTIGAFDTTGSISPDLVSTTNTCTSALPVTLDSLSGNLYMWSPLLSSGGQLLGEVNPAGLNLGTVNASLYVNSGAVRTSNSIPYLDRNIQITPANTPSPNYYTPGIRLYATQAEINAYNTASRDTVLSDFETVDNEDNCGPAIIDSGTNLGKITDYGLYQGNNYYLSALTNTFSSYYFFKGSGSLPLHFIRFTAQECNTDNVCLDWSTTNEINVSSIKIEKSADGSNFNTLAVVKASNGSGINYYSATDKQPFNGNNFYRLKSIDKDGHFMYSQTELVKFNSYPDIQVAPNPANNFISIHSTQSIQSIELMNTEGQLLQKIAANGNLSETIQTSQYAAGLYYVRIETSKGFVVKKINIVK